MGDLSMKLKKIMKMLNEFGIKITFLNYLCFLICKNPEKSDWEYFLLKKKHKAIIHYLEVNYREIIEKYKFNRTKPKDFENSGIIWTIWWQGEDNAPEALKMCFRSMRKFGNGHKVVVITKDNYLNYIKLPDYILKKVENENINLIHLADIIRMSLMREHGGLWLDATIFLSNEIPEEYFQLKYFTTKLAAKRIACVSEQRWNGTVFGGSAGYIFFNFMVEFYEEYWKRQEKAIDYFLIDYMTEVAYRNIPNFKNALDELPINNVGIFETTPILNQKFNSSSYDTICRDNTCFHKIQRRINYYAETENGEQTLFGFLINQFN